MAATPLAATSSISTAKLRSGSSERILVIEHDDALRKVLQWLFSSEEYEVDVAFDAVCGLGETSPRSASRSDPRSAAPGMFGM
jgi:hypothetical protein